MNSTLNFSSPLKVSGRITTKFNVIDNLHARPHNGVDIAVHSADLYAPADGIIQRYYNKIGGLQVVILHDNGYRTGYAHLHYAKFPSGTKVLKGAFFAITGNSGHSTGHHLHFTLTNPKGVKIDPLLHFSF